MTEHNDMESPVAGCYCDVCEYARWWDSLSYEQQQGELEMMYRYSVEGGSL